MPIMKREHSISSDDEDFTPKPEPQDDDFVDEGSADDADKKYVKQKNGRAKKAGRGSKKAKAEQQPFDPSEDQLIIAEAEQKRGTRTAWSAPQTRLALAFYRVHGRNVKAAWAAFNEVTGVTQAQFETKIRKSKTKGLI
ncbi:hypothetical protein HDU85_000951 [Gaertneriomyces sp. JEL0708]|nr:hypothetical protein HDU85_000951 [Gaertneriomyces sp. JEL0708]